jgi:type II secretory pathway pseudopilin PulG
MKAKLLAGLLVIGAVSLALVLTACRTRLDAREIRCANNLKSIAEAAQKYRAQSNRLPQSLAELEAFGLSASDTNCPSAPPNYIFDATSTNLVICPTHRVHADGTSYRVSSNLVTHTSGKP